MGKIDIFYQQDFGTQEALFKTQTHANAHTHTVFSC